MPPRRLLVLMARWPAPLRCKSRLAVDLGAGAAAAVQQRLLDHALSVLEASSRGLPCTARLALAGAGLRSARRLLPRQYGIGLRLQGGGNLGVRLQRQVDLAFRQGFQQVVLVGSDLPQLAVADLGAAFAGLLRVPLVLGPAFDGGYWLVGLSRPCAALFSGVSWGGSQVLQQTCESAARHALPLQLLRQQADLDRSADLLPWR